MTSADIAQPQADACTHDHDLIDHATAAIMLANEIAFTLGQYRQIALRGGTPHPASVEVVAAHVTSLGVMVENIEIALMDDPEGEADEPA
jgi:hypothetical protein